MIVEWHLVLFTLTQLERGQGLVFGASVEADIFERTAHLNVIIVLVALAVHGSIRHLILRQVLLIDRRQGIQIQAGCLGRAILENSLHDLVPGLAPLVLRRLLSALGLCRAIALVILLEGRLAGSAIIHFRRRLRILEIILAAAVVGQIQRPLIILRRRRRLRSKIGSDRSLKRLQLSF